MFFEFSFFQADSNDDAFYARAFDGESGDTLGAFNAEATSSGQVSFDLSGIDPAITLLGLESQLNSWDFDVGSLAQIANVSLETAAASVPEPATMLLLRTGITGLFGIGRKRLFKS